MDTAGPHSRSPSPLHGEPALLWDREWCRETFPLFPGRARLRRTRPLLRINRRDIVSDTFMISIPPPRLTHTNPHGLAEHYSTVRPKPLFKIRLGGSRSLQFQFPALAEQGLEVLIGLGVVGEAHGLGIILQLAFETIRNGAQCDPFGVRCGDAEI